MFSNDLLSDKVIVISGGTKGVGKALAIACSKLGAHIVIGGRDVKSAEMTLKEINSHHVDSIFVHTDLHNISDCEKLFNEALSHYGKIDGFVNYAGITTVSKLTNTEETLFDEINDINYKAAFFCAKFAINAMKKNQGGSIIFIGSAHAWRGQKDRAAYACSKGALLTLTEHIAYHYAAENIRCNYITLGWTATEGEVALRKQQGISEQELHKMANNTIPIGRMMENADYLPGLIYLLSDYSKVVTGSNLRMSGGEYI